MAKLSRQVFVIIVTIRGNTYEFVVHERAVRVSIRGRFMNAPTIHISKK